MVRVFCFSVKKNSVKKNLLSMDIAQLTSFSICVPKKSAYCRFKLISSISVGFRDASRRFYAGSVDLVVSAGIS